MTFVERRRELLELLRWAPTRGPKRQALLDQLRALVRDELGRELAGQPSEPTPEPQPHSRRRPFYWLDQDEAHP